jgi:hypothetical protein
MLLRDKSKKVQLIIIIKNSNKPGRFVFIQTLFHFQYFSILNGFGLPLTFTNEKSHYAVR